MLPGRVASGVDRRLSGFAPERIRGIMRLRKATSQGILAVAYIAAHERKGLVPGQKLAKAIKVHRDLLSNSLPLLTRSRVLKNEPGRDNGYHLVKPAEKTTLLEIIEAIDGPVTSDIDTGRMTRIPVKARKKLERVLADLAAYRRSKLKRFTAIQFLA